MDLARAARRLERPSVPECFTNGAEPLPSLVFDAGQPGYARLMPRGKGIYEDEPRDHLEGAKASKEGGDADETDDGSASEHSQEPPD
jgi:hypothetical protein